MTIPIGPERPLVLVGCGNMGAALLKGWVVSGISARSIHVVEPSGPDRVIAAGLPAGSVSPDFPTTIKPAVVFLAVKPQIIDGVLATIQHLVTDDVLVVSIAAGISLSRLAKGLRGHRRTIRAMPNTPAALGCGSSVLIADQAVTDANRTLAQQLMSAAGAVHWIEDETLMNAVTALSGSGPAYVFYLIECLTMAGQRLNLPPDLAHALAQETVAGAGALALSSSLDPATLRTQVTSSGGTTAAGLSILMGQEGLAPLIEKTLMAACNRSKELGDS